MMSPNFGESALLTAGDECRTVDFFSATRSNNDLKDMLQTERTDEKLSTNEELYNFNERQGKGNELRLSHKKG